MPSNSPDKHYDQTVAIVRTALPRMSEFRIPITPANYAVWYEYLAKTNQALCQDMDDLLARGKPITEREMGNLYKRYLNEKDEQLQLAKQALARLLQTLLDQIGHADDSYSRFSSALGDIANDLSAEVSSDALNELIERALKITEGALEQGSTFKERLISLASEMEGLRDELARSQEQARVDPLTGLNNRLAFQEQIEALGLENRSDAHNPCLLMIDVDYFKRINDTYGHIGGDAILQQVGREILRNVRGKDTVARYGGEEFSVLLRDTPRSGCQTVAEHIRAGVASCLFNLPEDLALKEAVSVTVSIGGAWFREKESFASFVDRADRSLYFSKKGGRNRVTWEMELNEAKKQV